MSRQPEPWPSLLRRLEKVEAWIKRQGASSPFFGTGIHPTGNGGMESDAFDGDLSARSAGTKGWAFDDQKMAVGELILRPGSIGNDSLTNPVSAGVADARASNFAVPGGAYGLLAEKTVAVPAGFSTLLVTATGWMFARNPNTTGGVDGTGTDAIYCFVRVNGSDGSSDSSPYGQGISGFGGFTTATSGVSALKTGLVNAVTLQIWGGSTYQALPQDAQNSATLSATLLWLR